LVPNRPETGYGYVRCNDTKCDPKAGELPVYEVEEFVEKPDIATAESYLASGNYYWNSGMFIWQTEALLSSLRNHFPQICHGAS